MANVIDLKCRKFALKIKISRFEAFSVMQEKNYEKNNVLSIIDIKF